MADRHGDELRAVGAEFHDMVAVIAVNRWDGVRMADRQLADALADRMPVLYVDPPSSFVSRRRDRRNGRASANDRLRMIRPGLAHLTPEACPGLTRRGLAGLNRRLLALQVRRAVRRLHGSLRAVIDARVTSPVLGNCGEQLSIYWAQDDFAGMASLVGESADRLRKGEKEMTARADVVIAANPVVRSTVRSDGKEAELIPFGCDFAHFATAATTPPASDIRLPRPYAVFMGHVGERIAVDIMWSLVARDINLLVVGPMHRTVAESEFDALFDRPNVQWVGERPFSALPGYLAQASVGVLPYNHSAFNISSFPLKTLEYLAAGLPVVATDLPAIRWLDCPDVAIVDDPAGFADQVAAHMARRRDDTAAARRRGFAAEHTWDARAGAFAHIIGSPASAGVDGSRRHS